MKTRQPLTWLRQGFLLALTVALSCCQKSPVDPSRPQTPTVVRIMDKEYPVRLIGQQQWTVSNYAGPGGRAYRPGDEKPAYGRYYSLAEARAVTLPAGWRLPTLQDYRRLVQQQGVVLTNDRAMGQEAIKTLASTTNWRSIAGTNASGFDAQPAGYSFQESDPQDGNIAEFWTAEGHSISIQESAAGKAHSLLFYSTSDSAAYRFPLRFVRTEF